MSSLNALVWSKNDKSIWSQNGYELTQATGAGVAYSITAFDGDFIVTITNLVKLNNGDARSSDSKTLSSYVDAIDFVEREHYPHFMSEFVNQDTVTRTEAWFKAAKPEPTNKDIGTQTGCVLEEVVELLEGFGFARQGAVLELHNLAGLFKANTFETLIAELTQDDRVAITDACCDINVTSIGVLTLLGGIDILGATNEVIRSNNSKIVDGKFQYDENGKIMKPEGHFVEPDLKPFVGGDNEII